MNCKRTGNIAIDGPAGAGKSTVARKLADILGYIYIDTGAMYRALTWKIIEYKIDLNNEAEIAKVAENTKIELKTLKKGELAVYCDGLDVTAAIRQPEVSRNVSLVARIPQVRKHMLQLQKKMAQSNKVVMDGRDVGTFILPDAPYKFFLTADLEERARRRFKEIRSKGETAELETIKKEIKARDEQDTSRQTAPLKPAVDAVIIDTNNMSEEEVVAGILNMIEKNEEIKYKKRHKKN